MRQLLILRGPMGSGKSTWVREHGLEHYTLSSDEIRLLVQSPVLLEDGTRGISQKNEKFVWEILFSVLEERMKAGEFTVVDATHAKTSMISRYKKLCTQYKYRATVIDFSSVPLEELLRRNQQREDWKRVPEIAIRNSYSRMTTERVPNWVNVVDYDDRDLVSKTMTYSPRDLSDYKKIHHIGDIHGCYTVLMEYLKDGLKDDEYYIFVGDYLDRGIENGEVLRFLLEIKNKPNVVLLEGNHESKHLKAWAHDEPVYGQVFKNSTMPQIEGISKSDTRQLWRRLAQIVHYTYNGKQVLVNHAGISKIPSNGILFVATDQFVSGVGGYETDIDTVWSENEKEIYQIHGHRNLWDLPVFASERSFNLEGGVEKGGYLRVVTLDKNGFRAHEVKNHVFSLRESNKPLPSQNMTVDEMVEYFRNHELVVENKLDDNISSFSFTRKAFRDRNWDAVNARARGIFVNTDTNKIVARSYDKMFHINEREFTKIGYLKENLVFPVKAYEKVNGYLGILGYNEQTDELFFSSKNSNRSQHAQWFKELFYKNHGEQAESIKSFLKENNASMVFEVVLPTKDPHIIEYKDHDDFVVLLDIIKNTPEFACMSYEKLVRIAKEFGLFYKRLSFIANDWREFYKWFRDIVDKKDFASEEFPLEGYVIQDSSGEVRDCTWIVAPFMAKVKTPYYDFWKFMRSVKDSVGKGKEQNINTSAMWSELHNEFFFWLKQQDKEYLLETDIITLRNKFQSDKSEYSDLSL
jgi:predicted kinase